MVKKLFKAWSNLLSNRLLKPLKITLFKSNIILFNNQFLTKHFIDYNRMSTKNNFSLKLLNVFLLINLLLCQRPIDKIQDSQGKLKAISQQYKDLIASDDQNQYKSIVETVFQHFTRGQMAKVKLIKDNLLYNIKASKYCCNTASEQSTDLDEWV